MGLSCNLEHVGGLSTSISGPRNLELIRSGPKIEYSGQGKLAYLEAEICIIQMNLKFSFKMKTLLRSLAR